MPWRTSAISAAARRMRAILIGEVSRSAAARDTSDRLVPHTYSRGGDGSGVGPVLREYVVSECDGRAMVSTPIARCATTERRDAQTILPFAS